MKMFKKTIAVLLALIFLSGAFPPGLMSQASSVTMYSDVSGHWAAGAINRWNGFGFIDSEAFPGSNLLPDRYITRAEFFSLVIRSMGATEVTDISRFTDLDPDTWQYNISALACQMGIAQGYPDNTMRPNDNIMRQDAATLLAGTLGMYSVSEWTLSQFYDSAFISPYARSSVSAFVEHGFLSGYPDGAFRPGAFMTRAEAIRLLDNIFTHVYMPESSLRNVYLRGGLLISSQGAELREVVVDGDVVIGDGVGVGNAVIANSTINGQIGRAHV